MVRVEAAVAFTVVEAWAALVAVSVVVVWVAQAAALEEAPEWGRAVEASEEVAGVAVFGLAEVLVVVSVVVRVWAPVAAFAAPVGGVVPVAGAAVGDPDAALAGVVALVGVGVAGDIPTITGAGVIPVGDGVQALMLAVVGVGAGELPSFSGLPLALL
ncbi:hypothetical protein AA0313_0088 [Acetobacter indonesiensis NRIC 0313]|nr:hypothetical protein AA0313_0088 [Acetobacter indonesiensis NRIC 0313]